MLPLYAVTGTQTSSMRLVQQLSSDICLRMSKKLKATGRLILFSTSVMTWELILRDYLQRGLWKFLILVSELKFVLTQLLPAGGWRALFLSFPFLISVFLFHWASVLPTSFSVKKYMQCFSSRFCNNSPSADIFLGSSTAKNLVHHFPRKQTINYE